MDSRLFTTMMDHLSNLTDIYHKLDQANFASTEEGAITQNQLQVMISGIVETLSKHKGQIA